MTDIMRWGFLPRNVISGYRITGTKNGSGDNELVAAPGTGYRIVVKGWRIQNESASATTCILKAGTANTYRFLTQNQGDSVSKDYEPEYEWRLPSATALILNLSAGNSHNFNLEYWIETV